ncbi:hypothetical protein EGW08_008105 [Elysia chlorotica]|uniref:Zinc finger CCHC domain-containing protein 17 n=1 Tax=Elysia chlorotica TaxID=188477 RepID=A0A433TRG7_ELYCH|nr:hypothetical protein EGW08_008105 [Elysia chlorotica]
MSHQDGKGDIPKLHSIFHGEVASLQAYGAFVKIPGCKRQGLVHKSQMSSARIEDPSEMLAKGEMVYCKVIGFEGEGEKISLSMKVVNQTTGKDLDPNNVQMDQDAKKRRQWKHVGKDRIELGAELNTTCRRCGGHGHLTIDCFAGKDGTQYDLIPDLDTLTALPPVSELSPLLHKKKKKKKEKKKKKKAKKKRHSSSSSGSSASEDDVKNSQKDNQRKRSHSHRERSPQAFHKADTIRRERRTSDKRSRSASSSPEHNARSDKIRRLDDSSGESPTPSSRHGKRQRVDYTSKDSPGLHGAASSQDGRHSGQGRGRKGRGHKDSDSFSSDDSPPPKHRSTRPDADRRSGRRGSDDFHDHLSAQRGKSKNSPRGVSDDEAGARTIRNTHKRDKDNFDERPQNASRYAQGDRLTSRQREHSSERLEPRKGNKEYSDERRHRSRSSSRKRDTKKKGHRKRSTS